MNNQDTITIVLTRVQYEELTTVLREIRKMAEKYCVMELCSRNNRAAAELTSLAAKAKCLERDLNNIANFG